MRGYSIWRGYVKPSKSGVFIESMGYDLDKKLFSLTKSVRIFPALGDGLPATSDLGIEVCAFRVPNALSRPISAVFGWVIPILRIGYCGDF